MIHFYVDIEGTMIDNLFDANYLHHNCANIKNYIHKHDGHPYKVDFFTKIVGRKMPPFRVA